MTDQSVNIIYNGDFPKKATDFFKKITTQLNDSDLWARFRGRAGGVSKHEVDQVNQITDIH
jgi:hypothetical protein